MKRAAAVFALVLLAVAGLAVAGVRPALGGGEDKITICHASGQAGTTKFETLTISRNAVFGPGGHFNENGTPQAGHEQDYMGPCVEDTTTGTTTTTETTTSTGTTTTETTTTTDTTTSTTTTTPQPPCPNGEPPIHGKDGQPGNDACNPCLPPVNVEKCPGDTTTSITTTTTSPPTTTTEPPVTTTTEPPVTTTEPPSTTPPPKSNKPPKPKPPKTTPPKKHATPKPPPACPPGKPYAGKCGVQGSG